MRIGVLTSGGDAPGMNAAIRSVTKCAIARGHTVVGIRRGYEGMLEGDMFDLQLGDVDGISRFGGTILGTARSALFPTPEGQTQAKLRLQEQGIDGLVVIGGNGSLTGAHVLGADRSVLVVGIPASIDNDLGHTRLAIGVDTAVNTIVEACDRISDTAQAHRRAFIVEVMGRQCGYLAMRAGIAAEADAILYPEQRLSEEEIIERLRLVLRRGFNKDRGKKRVLIIKAEGVAVPTPRLVEKLTEHLKVDAPGVGIRETVLGHVVRGGSPSAADRLIAQRLGVGSVLALEDGDHDTMVAWEGPPDVGVQTKDPAVSRISIAEMLDETRKILDGTSPKMRRRVALLERAEALVAL